MKKNNLKKLVSNLPKHPNVLGRDRFFNSAVLIPLVKMNGEYHLLFQKRAATIRQGGDIWWNSTIINFTCNKLSYYQKNSK